MQERVERRLGELKAEYEAGQAKLTELDAERAVIEDAQLRLNGIIEVIEELLAPEDTEADRAEADGAEADGAEADGAQSPPADSDSAGSAQGEVSTEDLTADADDGAVDDEAIDDDASPATQAPSHSGAWTSPATRF